MATSSISSIGGRRATPGLSAYQSAKWAVGGFSEEDARWKELSVSTDHDRT